MHLKDYLNELENFREELKREGNPRSTRRSSQEDYSSRQRYAHGGNVRPNERVRELAAKGRYGDTKIAEIGPRTARVLDDVIHGGHEQINPRTGLREYPRSAKAKSAQAKKRKALSAAVDSGMNPNCLRKQGSERSCAGASSIMLSHHYNKGKFPQPFRNALDDNRVHPEKYGKLRKNFGKKSRSRKPRPQPQSGYNSEEAVGEVYGKNLPAAAYQVGPSGKGADMSQMAPRMGFKVGNPLNAPDIPSIQQSVKKRKPGFLNLETPSGANHVAILKGYKGSELHIADPKTGKVAKVKVSDVPYTVKKGSFLHKEGYAPGNYNIRGVTLPSHKESFAITQVSPTEP